MARPDFTYESLLATEFTNDAAFQDIPQPYEGPLTDPFFMADSMAILDAQEVRVKEQIIPNLENFTGTWHPNGFMVIPLGTNPKHGMLRLHIWPEGFRHERVEKPGIHNHAWHLASVCLKGTYQEEYYDLTKVGSVSEQERVALGALRSFQVGYNPGQPDELAFDSDVFTVAVSKTDEMQERGIHWIRPEAFHNTTIPLNECVATIALDSRPMQGLSPRVLLDTSADVLQSSRIAITREELATAREQLEAA